jgi:uncharacterized OB-fold protein
LQCNSWSITHQTGLPGFSDRVPYTLVTVDLAEGVRMLAPLLDVSMEDLRTGLPVKVIFEQQSDDTVIPVFVGADFLLENA